MMKPQLLPGLLEGLHSITSHQAVASVVCTEATHIQAVANSMKSSASSKLLSPSHASFSSSLYDDTHIMALQC